MPEPKDLLETLKNDPAALLKALQEIDANGDHTLDKTEVANWLIKHRAEIKIQGHSFDADLKSKEQSDAKLAKFTPAEQQAMTQKFMQTTVEASEKENLVNREMLAVTESIKGDLRANGQKQAEQATLAKSSPGDSSDAEKKAEAREAQAGVVTLLRMAGKTADADEKERQFKAQWKKEDEEAAKNQNNLKTATAKIEPDEMKKIRASLQAYSPDVIETPNYEMLQPSQTSNNKPVAPSPKTPGH